jgi:hypothetical protein
MIEKENSNKNDKKMVQMNYLYCEHTAKHLFLILIYITVL